MAETNSPTIAVWASTTQAPFLAEVFTRIEAKVVRAGSPEKGQSGAVASALSCPTANDLRALLATEECDAVWIASPGDLGDSDDPGDARAVLAARARGTRVLTSEPVPTSAISLEPWTNAESGPAPGNWLRFVALPRFSAAFREAHETLLAFGPARAAHVELWSQPAQGTLGARLVGAVDLLTTIFDEPESIDAAMAGPMAPGPSGQSRSSLRDLHGDLLATLRFSDSRAASIAVSNAAGRWGMNVTLIGANGRLRFFDDGFEWIGPDGIKHDESRGPGSTRGSTTPAARGVAAFADSAKRLLDPGLPDEGPINLSLVLSTCQAALLSARTRQPESPHTIQRLFQKP